MSEELRFHIESRIDDLIQSGMSPDEAKRQARLELGSAEKYKEEMRQARGLRLFDEFRADLKYAARSLRKNPTFSLAVILTLALGIGANSLVFSVVRAVILRPLDYQNPGELVALWERKLLRTGSGFRFPNYRDLARQATSFTESRRMRSSATSLSGDKDAECVLSLEVTDRFFDVLGHQAGSGPHVWSR
jgi:hypothetical protein